MPPASQVRILVTHPHELVCEGLRSMCASSGKFAQVLTAKNGQSAIGLTAEHRPEVALIGPSDRDFDGVALTKKLIQAQPDMRVIAIVEKLSLVETTQFQEAGASRYLSSAIDQLNLVAAIEQAIQDRSWVSPESTKTLPQTERVESALSAREIQVLELMRYGRSNIEIGKALHISAQTVLSHAKAIFGKLSAGTRAEAVAIGFELGYLRSFIKGQANGSWIAL